MVVNMSCPKCNGSASEYDTNKWCCLKCGNKFLYTPPPAPPPTLINTTVNIQGSGLFDLDATRSHPPGPVFKKLRDVNPSVIDEQEKLQRRVDLFEEASTQLVFWGAATGVCLLFLFVFIFKAIAASGKSGPVFDAFLFLVFTCLAVSRLDIYRKRRGRKAAGEVADLRRTIDTIEAEKEADVVAGHTVSCPYCEAVLDFILTGGQMPTGLRHCLKCGKQYFTGQGYSYPLIKQ